MRFRSRYQCRYGLPHDMRAIGQNNQGLWEICQICQEKYFWKTGYKNRMDNVRYLEVHARVYAQRTGPTKQLFNKLYRREETKLAI